MQTEEYIKMLMTKYLEGQTSLEEEKILRVFFQKEHIPKELTTEALWFKRMDQMQINESEIQKMEERASDWVDREERKHRNNKLRLWTYSIAATLLLAVGITLLFRYHSNQAIKDTYDDPQIAYLEARKILLYVSEKMNKGTSRLQTVSRIQEGTSEMSIFSTFGSGLKNLDLVSKFDESSAYSKKTQ